VEHNCHLIGCTVETRAATWRGVTVSGKLIHCNNSIQAHQLSVLNYLAFIFIAQVVETNLDREHFTQHGLHMNRLGKECISKRISENIKSILTRKWLPPISMKWKEDPMDLRPGANMIDRKSNDKSELQETEARTSGRQRRHPITRKDDFLWPTGPLNVMS
jgi:hypothetical protein